MGVIIKTRSGKKHNRHNRLSGLRLENFKGYKNSGTMPLAPLTIIVGKNSSGKSSLIKALLVMAQTVRDPPRNNEATKSSKSDLRLNGKLTNLGTFFDTVNGNSGKEFSISFFVEPNAKSLDDSSHEYVYRFSYQKSDESPLQAKFSGVSVHYGKSKLLSAKGISLASLREGRHPHGHDLKYVKLGEEVLFHEKDPKETENKFITALLEAMKNHHQSQEGFVDNPDDDHFILRLDGLGLSITNSSPLRPEVEARRALYGQTTEILGLLEGYLSGAVYVGPLREQPSREARISHSSESDIGIRGEDLPQMLHSLRDDHSFMGRLNEHLKSLKIGDSVHTSTSFEKNHNGEVRDTGFVRTHVVKDGVSRSLMDLGFGTSQVLPVLFQLTLQKDRLILLEQPELHLHPSAQSELGTIFLDSMDRGNQLIVETHSANIIARIQKLIRDKKIDCDDVQLLYMKSENDETKCVPIGFYEDGTFDETWPEDDFFSSLEKDLINWG